MADLLKKLEEIPDHPTSFSGLKSLELKHEIIDAMEELAKEINYRKDQVKLLINSANNRDELTDTYYKLQDLQTSLQARKKHWETQIPHADGAMKMEMDKVIAMLTSSAEKIAAVLQEAIKP